VTRKKQVQGFDGSSVQPVLHPGSACQNYLRKEALNDESAMNLNDARIRVLITLGDWKSQRKEYMQSAPGGNDIGAAFG